MELNIGLHVRNKHSGVEGIIVEQIKREQEVTGARVHVKKLGGSVAWHIDDIEIVAGHVNLRRVRQIKRATLITNFADAKFVSDAVARNFVVFGGEVAKHKGEEAKAGGRTVRALRFIRKLKREQEAKSAALRGARHV